MENFNGVIEKLVKESIVGEWLDYDLGFTEMDKPRAKVNRKCKRVMKKLSKQIDKAVAEARKEDGIISRI